MTTKIKIPSELSEITLEQYQFLMSIQREDDTDDIAARKMIAVFCRIKMSEVMKIEFKSVTEIMEKFNRMFSNKQGLINRFKLSSTEFGFIPNLETISFGEFIDIEKYMSDWKTMHNAMAVLYRPIIDQKGFRYEIEEYQTSITYADVMKAMPLDVALGANVFFWNLGKELFNGIVDFLKEETKTMHPEILAKLNSSEFGGDGTNPFTHLHKETLQDLMKLPNYPSTLA